MKVRRYLICVLVALIIAVMPIGMQAAFAADSTGGYGAPAAKSDSGGGYGAPASSDSSGGYGSSSSSGGYGSTTTKSDSGGYGAPAKSDSGGYGSTETKKESGGYGEPAKSDSGGYGEPAAKSDSGGGYGEEKPAAAAEAPTEPAGPNGMVFVLTALACGMALGWVLQRGRFCMNSAFRDTIFIKDWTYFHSYLIAAIVAIIGANLLKDLGIIKLGAQPFWPIAHIVGGYVFGLGIVLAGGCGSGIWYRVGEGLLAAWVAVFGFFLGIGITMSGLLKPLYLKSRSIMLLADKPTVYEAVGATSMVAKWVVIAVIAAVFIFFAMKSKPFKPGKQKGYYWSVTGLLIGLIATAAFWASYQFGGGFARGLSFTTPTIELFNTLTKHDAQPTIFPMVTLLGYIKTTWGVFFIVGVPLGAYLSARGMNEFLWKIPPAKELLTVMFGSLLMGFGATLALGCNMGQGITGVATLSIGSLVATLAIILGNWTMVYFKFIKPMQDLDLDDEDV